VTAVVDRSYLKLEYVDKF